MRRIDGEYLMPPSQLYTAIAGDVVTAARWNNEFGNIYDNLFDDPSPTLEAADDALAADITALDTRITDLETATNVALTGDVKLTLRSTADTGWILAEDKSIGDATSGATGRANADTSALYSLIWTNVTDTWAPVAGGRGASAAADFAAHKALSVPQTLGRALAGYGVGTVVATGVNADVDTGAANSLTVATNTDKWVTGMSVVFVLTSGTITGLTSSTTYYVIRSSSTLVQLASSLANAQNGTEIDLTAKSSPVWSITHTYSTRVIGEAVGQDTHAMSITELLAHTHAIGDSAQLDFDPEANSVHNFSTGDVVTQSTGGNAAMNVMQPTVFLNVMIKL
jgi:hypothetical protein